MIFPNYKKINIFSNLFYLFTYNNTISCSVTLYCIVWNSSILLYCVESTSFMIQRCEWISFQLTRYIILLIKQFQLLLEIRYLSHLRGGEGGNGHYNKTVSTIHLTLKIILVKQSYMKDWPFIKGIILIQDKTTKIFHSIWFLMQTHNFSHCTQMW